jgi:phosphoribosylformylglycinamidine synthase subunit PurSL
VAESAFAGGYGIEMDLREVPTTGMDCDVEILFSESASRFIITLDPACKEAFEAKMRSTVFAQIGRVRKDRTFLVLGMSGKTIVQEEIFKLKKSWQTPLARKKNESCA